MPVKREDNLRELSLTPLLPPAAILLWLIGTAAERCGLHERLRPGSRKRRAYSRVFLARLLLTLEACRATITELVDAIGPLDQWVASDHDALLAE